MKIFFACQFGIDQRHFLTVKIFLEVMSMNQDSNSSKKIPPIVRKLNSEGLSEELNQCKIYAERGYLSAMENYEEILEILQDESNRLSQTLREQRNSSRLQNSEYIKKQLDDIHRYIDKDLYKLKRDIDSLREGQQYFTIVVYGKTMVGKSTLREILTQGDGTSIGNGSQRTTRDVCEYFWNGLRIFDVPGVCSYDGSQDDEIALKAAESADLILFLLSDGNPQHDEAQALANLRKFGKPVIGIVNVRQKFDMEDREFSMSRIQKKLADTTRINDIINQFKQYDRTFDQNWDNIEFVSAHLLSAFEAQKINDGELWNVSNFSAVEQFIIDKVRDDGKFLRIKTFSDVVAVPMQKIIDTIYDHSGTSLKESLLFSDTIDEFFDWREKFIKRTQKRFEQFQNNLRDQMDQTIFDFAEHNYESKTVKEDWQSTVKRMNLPRQCENFLRQIADEATDKCQELSDQLSQELRMNFSTDVEPVNFETSFTLTNWEGPASTLYYAAIGALWGGPVGLAIAIGGTIFSNWLWDSTEEKIAKQKAELREKLIEATAPMFDELNDNLLEIANEQIINDGLNGFTNALFDRMFNLSNLGKDQYDLGISINSGLRDITRNLLSEAAEYKNIPDFADKIEDFARVPGDKMILSASENLPNLSKIEALLDEKIEIIPEITSDNIIQFTSDFLKNNVDVDYIPLNSDENAEDAFFWVADHIEKNQNFVLAKQLLRRPIIEVSR